MTKLRVNSLVLVIVLLSNICLCSMNLYMTSTNAEEFQHSMVIKEGEVQDSFLAKTFDNPFVCANGMLRLVQFNASRSDPRVMQFVYDGVGQIKKEQIEIKAEPNRESPIPRVIKTEYQSFTLESGCKSQGEITIDNYYNHVIVNLRTDGGNFEFSFLVNCDKYNRHKKFEYGYLLVGLINAAITIGVAMHSRIWSIRFNEKPLRILLTWKLFLLIMIILIVVGITFYLVASKEFKMANNIIKYLGIVVALVFTFICMNEVLYLFRPLKKVLIPTNFYNIRLCETLSLLFALILFIVSLFVQNWILYTFLAGCICVGSIKMLYFNSMQQAFYSLAISVCSVTLIAVVLHFVLPRSYNDYASELSSPLFIEVPDLVNNLFKKCSWLPVVDIIVPGVLLSFLRTYDENFSTGWGGVYTVTGNLSFLIATTFWIGIEALYPFSVPFSLITYTILLLSICVIAFKRNELKTLWGGYFLQHDEMTSGLLREDEPKRSIHQRLDEETMNAIKIKDSMTSKSDLDDAKDLVKDIMDEPFNPNVVRSGLRTNKEAEQISKLSRKSSGPETKSKNLNVFSSGLR